MILFNALWISVALFVSLSLIYSTIKLGISPMPSSKKAYMAIVHLIKSETNTEPVIDLGSGWGNFIIPFAKQNPHREVIGYELSLLPWLTSLLIKKAFRLNNLKIYKQNFYCAPWSNSAVIVCYLYPEAMQKIEQKLINKKINISCVISHYFALPNHKPKKTMYMNDLYKSPVYFYSLEGDS